MHYLTGARRSYDWGSPTAMAEFLGLSPDGEPFAELWLGAHPTDPSMVEMPTGVRPLDGLIAGDGGRHLGADVSARFGRLPYLVKLLAPARPLSIQVHPDRELACAGFAAEERAGVPLDDLRRSFKDEHHKPEMVYAITRFEGLVGFRPKEEVLLLLGAVAGPVMPAFEALSGSAGEAAEAGLRTAMERLLALDAEEISLTVKTAAGLAATHPDRSVRAACCTVAELAESYPGDVGVVVSLLLNRVVLEPGQLVFLGDGVPHAYLGGFGLEVMANSDNVLRLGLTSKTIDIPAMLQAIDFASSGFAVETAPGDRVTHVFRPPVAEYALSITRPALAGVDDSVLPGSGPRILVCLEGCVTVGSLEDAGRRELVRGQAVFAGAAEGALIVTGDGVLAQAFVPEG